MNTCFLCICIVTNCRGDFGRLGHGDSSDVFLPRPIQRLAGLFIRQVSCGDTHTLVVTDAGVLYSFGRNQNGQLGLGMAEDVLTPQVVTALSGHQVSSKKWASSMWLEY